MSHTPSPFPAFPLSTYLIPLSYLLSLFPTSPSPTPPSIPPTARFPTLPCESPPPPPSPCSPPYPFPSVCPICSPRCVPGWCLVPSLLPNVLLTGSSGSAGFITLTRSRKTNKSFQVIIFPISSCVRAHRWAQRLSIAANNKSRKPFGYLKGIASTDHNLTPTPSKL
jgi:hypothetical protein